MARVHASVPMIESGEIAWSARLAWLQITAKHSVIGRKLAVITVAAWRTALVRAIKASRDHLVVRVSQICLE